MLRFTKEKFTQLCIQYLEHIEAVTPSPAAFICEKLRQTCPIGQETQTYVTLMLLDPEDRFLLGQYLVYLHYAEKGKNFFVEWDDGCIGHDSAMVARELSKNIIQRADAFIRYKNSVYTKEEKKTVKRINALRNESARLKKEIRSLENELDAMRHRIDKKTRLAKEAHGRLSEVYRELEELTGEPQPLSIQTEGERDYTE